MSRLNEMLRELCPAGVEYRPLKDLCKIKEKEAITKSDLIDGGKYPVINSSREILGYYSRCNNEGDTLALTSHGAHAGFCHYMREPFFAGALCYPMQTSDVSVVTTKFLYYLLKNGENHIRENFVNRSGVPYVNFKALMSYELPLPPLPIQREIVRILDAFTSLTAELTAELTARKRQYAYHRDRLLTFGDEVPRVRLGEVAVSFYRGSGIKREQVTEVGVPCVRYGEIYTAYNTSFEDCISCTRMEYVSNPKFFEYGDILFAITGESVDDIAKSIAYVGHEKCLAGGDIVVMKHRQNPKYLAHVLNTTTSREQKAKGRVKSKVVHSNVPSIEKIEIPLPPLEEQERLAAILDRFDALCNDLADGLPAEIAARKKQYAYYRDKLLTFETGK